MIILDTDVLTLLERGTGMEFLRSQLAQFPSGEVATTIITYEEQTRGWLAYFAKAKTVAREVSAYARLLKHLLTYREIDVVPFDEAAAVQFQRLRRQRTRLGTMDLRIAGIALSRKATLVSRNLADFQRVHGLDVVDWTTPD